MLRLGVLFVGVLVVVGAQPGRCAARVTTRTQVSPASIIVGNRLTLFATVRRADTGVAVGGMEVRFRIDGNNVGSTTTDATSGIARLAFNVEERFRPGRYTIRAEARGNSFFHGSDDTDRLNVQIATPSLNAPFVSGQVGATVSLTASLRRADGTPVNNRRIQFQVDGRNVGSARTGPNGLATVSYQIRQPGAHPVVVLFEGDDYYRRREARGNVTGAQ